jgi:hypothetical protein
VVGDFNGDGKPDLAVANVFSNNVSILLGDGTGQFGAATNFPVGVYPFSIAVGDFNGDGNQDLAVGNFNSNNVSILLGDGAGHFSAPTNFPVSGPGSVAVGDFDGDGKQDLAVANYSSTNVSILLGDGMGHFSAATTFSVGTNPESVAIGDFNGDGKQDLAVANNSSNNASILLRTCTTTPTVSSAVSRKTHGGAGNFDINMPQTGSSGVECRTTGGTNDFTLVVTFTGNVTVTGSPQAQVTSGTGCVGSAGVCNGNVSVSGAVVTVPLTTIANAQVINVRINGVNGAGSDDPVVNIDIPMGFLIGDTNGNRAVNASDVSQTKSRSGQAVDGTNFRSDVNANGSINAGDAAVVKQKSGTSLPP